MIMREILVYFFAILFLTDGSNDNKQLRVMGGRLARKGEFPFAVRIGGACGGALFKPDVVMTAAHCFWMNDQVIGMGRKIIAGVLNDEDETNPAYQYRTIKNVKFHPEKRQKLKGYFVLYHDIAMVTLTSPFRLTDTLKVARIVSADPEKFKIAWYKIVKSGKTCFSMGWGTTCEGDKCNDNGPNSKFLRVLEVKPWSDERCGNNVPSNLINMAGKGEACAQPVDNIRKNRLGPGDSGGPLICDGFVYGIHVTGSYSEKLKDDQLKYAHHGYYLYFPYIKFFGLEYAAPSNPLFSSAFSGFLHYESILIIILFDFFILF